MDLQRTPSETPAPRMGRLARLPVFFALAGKRVVLAGSSRASAWKAELLSATGAQVDVYAADHCEEMRTLSLDPPCGSVVLHARAWWPADLAGAALAVGDCSDERQAATFALAARKAGVPVNLIDKPAFCDFAFGAIVNRSPLVIGISTDGAAPVFAQAIRAKLEAFLPKGFSLWAAAAKTWRDAVQSARLSPQARRRFWEMFAARALANPEARPAARDFEDLIGSAAGATVESGAGSVTLVGAGPGDPELLTLRAVRALQSADVILFDDLVSRDVLDFARREARKMLVGKTGFGPSCKQEDINALIVGLARQGKRVVRLKGGDPLIFARASEELEACAKAGVPVAVVPGISAAQGAAAALRLPLTGRGQSRRLQFVTGHAQDGGLPEGLDWPSLSDAAATTAIYMPTRTLPALVERAMQAGLDPLTPAIAVSRATRSDQQVVHAPLSALHDEIVARDLPGPVLVLFGQACRQVQIPQATNEERGDDPRRTDREAARHQAREGMDLEIHLR